MGRDLSIHTQIYDGLEIFFPAKPILNNIIQSVSSFLKKKFRFKIITNRERNPFISNYKSGFPVLLILNFDNWFVVTKKTKCC